MLSQRMNFSLAILSLLSLVDARRKIRPVSPTNPYPFRVDNNNIDEYKAKHKKHKSPIVKAGTCPEECFFKDLNNYWCVTSTSPMVQIGWEWEYTNTDPIRRISLQPYIKTQLSYTSDFMLKRFFYS